MSWHDPCKCGHSYEDHILHDDGPDHCKQCNCTQYRQDTSWTDDPEQELDYDDPGGFI